MKFIFLSIFFILSLSLLSINVHAADEHVPSNAFPVIMGITDDVAGDIKFVRVTPEGYIKIYQATNLSSTSDSIRADMKSSATATGVLVACNTATNGELLLASNASRVGVRILNQSAVDVYICLGDATCSTTTDGMRLMENMGIEDYHFTGAIYCTVNSGTANVFVGEY